MTSQRGDEHTRALLRGMQEGGTIAGTLDQTKARELLRTPPSNAPYAGSFARHVASASAGSGAASALPIDDGSLLGAGTAVVRADDPSVATGDLVQRLQDDVDAFKLALVDNVRLAKEQMQRSLLQLFEDTVREKLADTLSAHGRGSHGGGAAAGGASSGGGGGGSGGLSAGPVVAGSAVRALSKRLVDRGLDRRDHPSDVVIPDAVRREMGESIYTVVDHEMKRCFGVIGADTTRILQQVLMVRDRMSRMEEELLQRSVENRMQADQLQSAAGLIASLQAEVTALQRHATDKDAQMDLLRDQIARRNAHLDESRVKFRKEVMRCKSRIYELESELEASGGRRRAELQRRSSGADLLADDDAAEVAAATELAVKDLSDKFQEELRQMRVAHSKEKKTLMGEMAMKIAERDSEILRLKERLRDKQTKDWNDE